MARHLRECSVAASTLTKYRRHWARWLAFCASIAVDPLLRSVPVSSHVDIVSDFILSLSRVRGAASAGLRSSSLSSVLHGINHFFRACGLAFPISHPQICMLLKGLSRLDPPPRSKAPVSLALLGACFRRLDFALPQDQALWGVLCLSFFFLLRRSEIVAENAIFKRFALRADDVVVLDAHGFPTMEAQAAVSVCISLRGSKTDQQGKGASRLLSRSGHRCICPVFGALLLKHCHGSLPGSWPIAVVQGPVSPIVLSVQDVSEIIKSAAVDLGESAKSYGTHSLRIGGATQLYKAGVDSTTIQFQGRWVSDAFKRYTRLSLEVSSKLSEAMLSGSGDNTTIDHLASMLHALRGQSR